MNQKYVALIVVAVCNLFTTGYSAFAQGTAFTYQGQLRSNGVPLNGLYDFEFTLSNAPSGGSPVGSPVTNLAVGVTNGLFTTTLDFGAVFTGNDTWVAISVRSNNVGSYTPMTPLQELTPTPYAIYTAHAGTAATASAIAASNISGTLPLGDLPANVITNGANGVVITGTFTGNGSGLTNVPGTILQVVSSSTNVAAQANTAYDLTNSAPSVVTLPASANVGDVVQVTGTGAGGWEVAGLIPLAWTEQANAPTSANWFSIASSSNGTYLAAVVLFGGIYTSTNSGATWTEQTGAPTSGHWFSVASSADGTHLVAVAESQGIYTSANSGVTWTQQNSAPASSLWYSVASSSDGTHLVAVSESGGIYTSANSGVTWTQQTSGAPTSGWYSVASSADGTHLAAVIYGGGIYTSANSGATWTEQSGAATSGEWFSVTSSADGTHLAAALSPGTIYTSANSGVTWTQSGAPSAQWQSMASSADGTYLAAAVFGGGIYVSTNSGVSWTEQSSAPTSANWYGVAISADATHLAAVVKGGGLYTEFEDVITGATGTSEQFQYVGNGVWQPLPPTAGYVSGNGSVMQLPATFVTNGENGVTLNGTFSGVFSGSGSGLTGLNASQLTGTIPLAQLPSAVITNNETSNVTLQGTFNGNGGGLTNLNAAQVSGTFSNLAVTGSLSGGYGSDVALIQNTNTSGNTGPALRVVGSGNTASGALSVSSQGSGLIAQFGNGLAFVGDITTNGTFEGAGYNGGTIRVGSNGTTITNMEAGQAIMLASSMQETNYTITFPTAFSSSPKIIFSLANDPGFQGVSDVFAASVSSNSPAAFSINVYRLNGTSWSQSLRINWQAWQ